MDKIKKDRVFYRNDAGMPYLIKDDKLFYWYGQRWNFSYNNDYDKFPDNMPKQLQKIYLDQHYETTGERITLNKE